VRVHLAIGSSKAELHGEHAAPGADRRLAELVLCLDLLAFRPPENGFRTEIVLREFLRRLRRNISALVIFTLAALK